MWFLALYRKLRRDLDEGESQAIALAKELNADLLLIDETKGRDQAKKLGIRIIGLLGILLIAKQKCILKEIKPSLLQLKANNFYFKESLNWQMKNRKKESNTNKL